MDFNALDDYVSSISEASESEEKPVFPVYSESLITEKNREQFMYEVITPENMYFTEPQPTMMTMEGYITNILFKEEEAIAAIKADKEFYLSKDIIIYRCNFGEEIYEGYTEPPVKVRTNRGRKAKDKKSSTRKKQGKGTELSTQLSCFVVSRNEPCIIDTAETKVPSSANVYKFKVFRNGKIQLPGSLPKNINDIYDCINILIPKLQRLSNNGAESTITSLGHVLKNYKFAMKLTHGEIFNHRKLKEVLLAEKARRPNFIHVVECSEHKSKTKVKFYTPRENDPNKTVVFNIFMKGKINILGAYDVNQLRDICIYLQKLLINTPGLIIYEGTYKRQQDNIDSSGDYVNKVGPVFY
jgi:hypothetical protein